MIPRAPSASCSTTSPRWSASRSTQALLVRALTHRSYAYEHGGLPNNERLEFLGDSVLGPRRHRHALPARTPDLPEGQLAKLRAAVVNMRALADVARTLGLGDYVFLGRGEEATGGRDKASILADTVEALIGAGLPRPAGIDRRRRARPPPRRPADDPVGDPRGRPGLEDQPAGAHRAAPPSARPSTASTEDGPDHEKEFVASAVVGRRGPAARHRPEQEGGRAGGRRAGLGRARPAPPRPARPRAATGHVTTPTSCDAWTRRGPDA